jgi:hypothetical protein
MSCSLLCVVDEVGLHTPRTCRPVFRALSILYRDSLILKSYGPVYSVQGQPYPEVFRPCLFCTGTALS